jgi:hypothetical protein
MVGMEETCRPGSSHGNQMASNPRRDQEHTDGLAERLTVAPELLSEDDRRQRRHHRHVHHPDREWRQTDRCLSQSSAACAISRQPWSIVSEWPRSGNSMKSVMAGDLW